jgi:hypothetical protein
MRPHRRIRALPAQSYPKLTAEAAASPSGYRRGEGQKPVSKAYRDNWNVIFAKKKKR